MDYSTAEHKIESTDPYIAVTQTVAGSNFVLTDSDGDTLTLLDMTTTLGKGFFVKLSLYRV